MGRCTWVLSTAHSQRGHPAGPAVGVMGSRPQVGSRAGGGAQAAVSGQVGLHSGLMFAVPERNQPLTVIWGMGGP